MDKKKLTNKRFKKFRRLSTQSDNNRRLQSIEKQKQTEEYLVSQFGSHLSPPLKYSIYSTLKDNSDLRNDAFDEQLLSTYCVKKTRSFSLRSCAEARRNNRRFHAYTAGSSSLNSNVGPVSKLYEQSTIVRKEVGLNNNVSPSCSSLQDQDELVVQQVDIRRQTKLRYLQPCLLQRQNVSKIHDTDTDTDTADTTESIKKMKTYSELFTARYSESDVNIYSTAAVNDGSNIQFSFSPLHVEKITVNETHGHKSQTNIHLTNIGLQSFISHDSIKLYSYNLNSEFNQQHDKNFISNKNTANAADFGDDRPRWQLLPDCLETSLTPSSEKLEQIRRELQLKKI